MEYARFLFGVFLMVLSGYLWSIVIFKKMSSVERVVFGFGFTLAFSSFVVMLSSFWIKVTSSFLFIFFIIYIGATVPFLAMKIKKSGLPFSLPEKKKMIKGVILAGILLFVFYMTFLPHSVNDYNLPFHADEWIHWGYTHGFMNHGDMEFPNPFTGGNEAISPEIGFHVFLANFKWLFGAELVTIFLFMPSLLAVFTSLAAFCLGERSERKFGLEAAFLVAFIPTSVRFLGPSFLVPLSLGLFLALFSLLIAQLEGYRKYPLLLSLVFFTALVHPPSAVAMVITLLCYAIFLPIEKKYKEGAVITLATIIPFLIAYFIIPKNYFEMGINALFGEEYVSTLPKVLLSLDYLGNIVWTLFFFASFMAIYKGKALQRGMFLAAFSFILIIFLYDKYTFGLPIIYDRSFSYLFLFVAVLAGYGLAGVRGYGEGGIKYVITRLEKIFQNRNKRKILTKGGSIAITILLCSTIASLAIPEHKEEEYYKMVNENEFSTFDWIGGNIDKYRDDYHSFEKAAVNPSKASVFSAVTGVYTLSAIFHPKYGVNILDEVNDFLDGKGKNIDFLEKYDIEVIYGDAENEYIEMVHENVYLYYGMPPIANFTFTPNKPKEKETVTFVSTSTTPYGSIINWSWDYGDGNKSQGTQYEFLFREGDTVRTRMKMNRSFTVEMWLWPGFSYDDGETHEWFLWSDGGTYINCYKHSNNRVYFVVRGEKWESAASVIEFEENTWHHFAGVYNGWTGTFNLYWDGKIMEVSGGGGVISSEEGAVIIGGRNGRWFNGDIKDVRIYGRTLSDTELEGNYQGNVTTDDLLAWWKLNESHGAVAHDKFGRNDATIYGIPEKKYRVHAYKGPGEYEVTLIVLNEDGFNDSISKKIVVSP